jgi:hypothetical protein
LVIRQERTLFYEGDDSVGVNRLIRFTPEGEYYVLAQHVIPLPEFARMEEELPENVHSEVAGPTFSPDGQTLYFNIQVLA